MTDCSKRVTMTSTVINIMNRMPAGTKFHGNQLHDAVKKIYPPAEKMYTDTILRTMRRYCKTQYRTVNHNKSLFEKV